MRENQTAHFNAIFLRRRHNAISYGLWLVAWSGLDWPYLKIICDDFCEIPRNFDCEHKKNPLKTSQKTQSNCRVYSLLYFPGCIVCFVLVLFVFDFLKILCKIHSLNFTSFLFFLSVSRNLLSKHSF